jgi:RNA-dependent RNA polymerase
MKLTTPCSQAVDYAKNGSPVEIHSFPKPLIKFKPDWHRTEVTGTRELDYYVSEPVLGYTLYSGTSSSSIRKSLPKGYLQNPPKQNPHSKIHSRMSSCRSFSACSTRTRMRTVLSQTRRVRTATRNSHTSTTFTRCGTCITHTLIDAPDVRLEEEEVVPSTILADCAQPR